MSCHRALRTRRFIPKARPSLITCHTLALLAPRHEGSSLRRVTAFCILSLHFCNTKQGQGTGL